MDMAVAKYNSLGQSHCPFILLYKVNALNIKYKMEDIGLISIFTLYIHKILIHNRTGYTN
jgi:hypothetical protein